MDRKELANLIFPDVKDYSYYEEKYPERNLPEGAEVVRVAPSPTGFIHVGGLFQGLIAKTIARKTNSKNKVGKNHRCVLPCIRYCPIKMSFKITVLCDQ